MKDELCDALIMALPEGPDDFVVYYVASNQGFGCVLMQRGDVQRIENKAKTVRGTRCQSEVRGTVPGGGCQSVTRGIWRVSVR
ncbi:hypothetical protein Tco_0886169, partial [Tanacetum coccineum]